MSDVKWTAIDDFTTNLIGAQLNSLANGSTTSGITVDNTTMRAMYGILAIELGSITPVTNGSILVRIQHNRGGNDEDLTTTLYSEQYVLLSGASAKRNVIPNIIIYPVSFKIRITNNSGVTLNAANNAVYFGRYNEEIV